MAKRKRLTPAQPDHFATRAPETKSMPGSVAGPGFNAPPIAQVAGDTATHAALNEVTSILEDARAQGRLIEALPLKVINAKYMLRDRILRNDEDMETLMISLRARGQQTPIEVIALPDIVPFNAPPHAPGRPNYGLISGWRRLSALIRLYEETGEDRFATIKALIVTPDTAQDAYVAMVEENEIRVNLSLYERARIALHAADEGIFPTPRHAVLALFEAAPRAKRSKISSFIGLVRGLDGVLMFPKAIPEKFGLELVRGLEKDPGLKKNLRDRLTFEDPKTMGDEMDILVEELRLSQRANIEPAPESVSEHDLEPESQLELESIAGIGRPPISGLPYTRPDLVGPALWLRFDKGANPRIELSGAGVDAGFYRALKEWLAEQGK